VNSFLLKTEYDYLSQDRFGLDEILNAKWKWRLSSKTPYEVVIDANITIDQLESELKTFGIKAQIITMGSKGETRFVNP
jgi:hypothetical protein